jgi:predicted metallo-beta-lactamase superfamily hydrolase
MAHVLPRVLSEEIEKGLNNLETIINNCNAAGMFIVDADAVLREANHLPNNEKGGKQIS